MSNIQLTTPDAQIPSEELLGRHEFVFRKETLERLRDWGLGKRILVIDLHGILIGLAEREKTNPYASETLQILKEMGYTLILWSSATNADYDNPNVPSNTDLLERAGLTKYFDLMLFAENYKFQSTDMEKRDLYDQSCASTEWITEEERSILQEKSPAVSSQKPFPILFEECCFLDDDFRPLRMETILPSNHTHYPAIQPQTYNPRRGEEFSLRSRNLSTPFSRDIIPLIAEAFPPPERSC